MNFMFDLEDASNDGTIDAEEFSIVCSSYGLNKSECQEAFRKMSKVSIPRSASKLKVHLFKHSINTSTGCR